MRHFGTDEKLREKEKSRRNENPCFICTEPTYDWDYLCRDCRKDWYAGRKSRLEAASLIGRDKPERIPIRHYWSFMYGWSDKRDLTHDRMDINGRIKRAVIALAGGKKDEFAPYFSNIRAASIGSPNEKGGGSGKDVYVFPKRGTWKILKELTFAIRDLANYNYNKGFQDGSGLLARIASGDLSIEDINRRMIGK